MAARLFIAMIRNCNYDEPIDFDHIESDLEQTSGSEALPHSSGELAGSKRRANGTNAHPKKRTRKTTRYVGMSLSSRVFINISIATPFFVFLIGCDELHEIFFR